jgi:peptidyl-prolyl cis-trans isomerase D
MFDSIRSHRRWLMLFLLLLVFPSFVVTGIYGYNQFVAPDNAVAKVDGQPISPQELDAAHREQMDRLRGMFGEQFDPRMFDTPQARAATLENLLSQRALQREAQAAHLGVSPERLREVIAGESVFHQDGKFSYDRYRQVLAAQGLSELGFEQRVQQDLARQALLQAVAASAVVPRSVSEQVRRLADEQREVRELRFDPKDFRAKVSATEVQIKAYYEANAREFQSPESVRAEYVVLTLDDIAAQTPAPTDAELRAYYEQNKARFGLEEQRRASHILLTAGDGGTAGDKAGARKRAEELLARLKANPAEFDKLARENSKDPGSAPGGGDLGWFGRGMMVKPFEEAAFGMKEGEISGIVETDFGFHLIRLTGVRGASTKPFDEVKAQIEADLRRDAAGKRFAEVAEQFGNSVYEQPDSLKPVADKLKLSVQTVETLTRAGMPARPNTPQIFTPRLIEALFGAESLEKKRNTEAIEVASNTLVSARVLEHRPAALRPLAEVAPIIKLQVEQAEAARLAREAGEQRLAALQKVASDAGFAAPRMVSRARPEGLPVAAVNAVMRAPADKLPAYVGTVLDGGAYGIFQVLSSKVPEKSDAAQGEAQARALAQLFGAADDAAYVAALRSKHKAQVLSAEFRNAAKAASSGEAAKDGAAK